MAQKKTNDLGRDPVGSLLFRMALPTVTAQLVDALSNIVDRMYIGHIEGAGDLALTGLGVCFPIILLVSAISALIGMGGGSRAVVRMGEGKQEQANAILGNCATLLVCLALLVTVVCQAVKQPMLLLFGATENTLPYALDYLSIYLCGTVCVEISMGLNYFITSQGFTTVSMRTVLIGAVINIILDPIFIFGLDMGVKGAALATVLAQTVSALWVLRFLTGKRTKLRLQKKYMGLNPAVLAPVVALGVSPFVMRATESLVNISFNSSLKSFGGDPAVGAMTVCSSVMHVYVLILQGLAQGGQPIIGFNYGAGNFERVKKAFRLMVTSMLVFAALAWSAIQMFPGVFVGIFNDEPALVEIAVWTLRIYLAAIPFFAVQCACQQTFVALGQAKISLFLAVLRKIILLLPLIFILPHFFGNKVFAVFLAEPIADVLAASTTGIMFLLNFPKILKKRALVLEQGE